VEELVGEQEVVLRAERVTGRFARSVQLPFEVEAEKIAAEAAALLGDPERRDEMARRIATLGIANGVGQAVGALLELARAARH
jgi:hypothetical protein